MEDKIYYQIFSMNLKDEKKITDSLNNYNRMTLIYDKRLFAELKEFLISYLKNKETRKEYQDKPYLIWSLIKSLKCCLRKNEYKQLKYILNNDENKLCLDNEDEDLLKIEFYQNQTKSEKRNILIKDFITSIANYKKSEQLNENEFKYEVENILKIKFDRKKLDYRTIKYHIEEVFGCIFAKRKMFPFEDYQNMNSSKLITKCIRGLRKLSFISKEDKENMKRNKLDAENSMPEKREYSIINNEKLLLIYKKYKISKKEKIEKEKEFDKFAKEILGSFKFDEEFKDASLISFGSYKNGFALKDSDIDSTIITNSAFNERDLLNKLDKHLNNSFHSNGIKNFEIINLAGDNIRIPILKISYGAETKDKKIDLAINNILGVCNSRLLEVYSKIDKRCKQLGVLIKIWAKSENRGITAADSLSSYSLLLLLIYFLQLKKILPSVQKINQNSKIIVPLKRWVKKEIEETFNASIGFTNDIEKIKLYMAENRKEYPENKQNLFELFLEFFLFYNMIGIGGCFKNFKMKCNIRSGQFDFINYDNEANSNGEKKFLFSIVDPFDKKHNPGDRVSSTKNKDKRNHIEKQIEFTIKALKDNKINEAFDFKN